MKFGYYEPLLITLFRINDAFLGALLYWIINELFDRSSQFQFEATLVVFLLILVSFPYIGVYRSWRVLSIKREFIKLFQACCVVFILIFSLSFLFIMPHLFPRKSISLWMLFNRPLHKLAEGDETICLINRATCLQRV